MNADLCEGLVCILDGAFQVCTSLERIKIPSSVTYIFPYSFEDCPNLVAIEFFTEIEDLVTELSLTDWYDHGRNVLWQDVYVFLMKHTILQRLGMITVRKWRDDVHDLLRRFPFIHEYKFEEYCSLIQRRLDSYDTLKDAASLLELALWKSKFEDQHSDLNSTNYRATKSGARCNCGAAVIIPNVLSLLVGIYPEDDIAYYETESGRMHVEESEDGYMHWYEYIQRLQAIERRGALRGA